MSGAGEPAFPGQTGSALKPLRLPYSGRQIQNRAGLLLRHSREELHEFGQGDAVLQVFEQSCHRDPGAPEHQGTAHALWITLHRRAASPAEFALHEQASREWLMNLSVGSLLVAS